MSKQCKPAYVWESQLMTLHQEKVQLLSSDQRLIIYMVLRRSGAMLLAVEKYFSTKSLRAVLRLGCWLGHFTQRANSLMHGYRALTSPIQCKQLKLNLISFFHDAIHPAELVIDSAVVNKLLRSFCALQRALKTHFL